jgi:tetratricopeptide (TPR) repeat protein
MGCYTKALANLQEAHERFAAADHLVGIAESLNSIANVYYRLGDYSTALAIYDEAFPLFHQLKQTSGQIRTLANKAAALIAGQYFDAAAQILDQADKIADGQPILLALRLKNRALLHLSQNDAASASPLLDQALSAVPLSDQTLLADIHYTIGQMQLIFADSQKALPHIEMALEIDRKSGAYYAVAQDLAAMGLYFDKLARYEVAVNYYQRSLKIFALLDAFQKVQWILPHLVDSAHKASLNINASLKWAELWLSGQRESGICR